MKKKLLSGFGCAALMIAMIIVTLILSGCGGANSTGSSSNDQLTIISHASNNGSLSGFSANCIAQGAGGAGSLLESMKWRITSFELKKADGTYVPIFSGHEYIECVGTGEEYDHQQINGDQTGGRHL